jgi:hypothetical protein
MTALSFQKETSPKNEEQRLRAFELVDAYLTNLAPAMYARNMGSCPGMTSMTCGGGNIRYTPNHPSEAGEKLYHREREKFNEMAANPYTDEAIKDRASFLRGEAKSYGWRTKLSYVPGNSEKKEYLKKFGLQMALFAGAAAAEGTYAATQGIFDAAGWNNAVIGAASVVGTFNGTAAAVTLAGLPRSHNEQIDFEEYRDIKRSLLSLKALKAQFRSVERMTSYYLHNYAKAEEEAFKQNDRENTEAGYLRADPGNPSHTAVLLKKLSGKNKGK